MFCINQNDEQDKAQQIGNTDLIYRGAEVTIVAACEPNKGLVGVNSPRPQYDVLHVDELAPPQSMDGCRSEEVVSILVLGRLAGAVQYPVVDFLGPSHDDNSRSSSSSSSSMRRVSYLWNFTLHYDQSTTSRRPPTRGVLSPLFYQGQDTAIANEGEAIRAIKFQARIVPSGYLNFDGMFSWETWSVRDEPIELGWEATGIPTP
ncbi:hypothetical protein B0T24DRAFT_589156 [Lasiosphaeria ovina]|uniref:Heterokaryon incompatibility domain-containing protein n=1 Tax=Lasiosphaeria ovina TaxID=92902 RepID=A0AAE0NNI2_9PEZI|nr:hypothetical protein B0T24DRAFT_589156 [Lasiosphaeria ovina]